MRTLNGVLEMLHDRDILAVRDITCCCQTCGLEEMVAFERRLCEEAEADEPGSYERPRGYCFSTGQDARNGDGHVWLSYGAFTDADVATDVAVVASVEVGKLVSEYLRAAGVPYVWDGDIKHRIEILDSLDSIAPPFHVSEFDLVTAAAGYGGGARGSAALRLRYAVQIIDVVVSCRPRTFALDHIRIGDDADKNDMIPGAGSEGGADADYFFAGVANRTWFTTLPAGLPAVVEFHNRAAVPEPIAIKVKVRSIHPRAELLMEEVASG